MTRLLASNRFLLGSARASLALNIMTYFILLWSTSVLLFCVQIVWFNRNFKLYWRKIVWKHDTFVAIEKWNDPVKLANVLTHHKLDGYVLCCTSCLWTFRDTLYLQHNSARQQLSERMIKTWSGTQKKKRRRRTNWKTSRMHLKLSFYCSTRNTFNSRWNQNWF